MSVVMWMLLIISLKVDLPPIGIFLIIALCCAVSLFPDHRLQWNTSASGNLNLWIWLHSKMTLLVLICLMMLILKNLLICTTTHCASFWIVMLRLCLKKSYFDPRLLGSIVISSKLKRQRRKAERKWRTTRCQSDLILLYVTFLMWPF